MPVVPDPLTTVFGLVVDPDGQPVAGAQVETAGGRTGTTGADGFFSITGVPTVLGELSASASAEIAGTPFAGSSAPALPAPGDITDVGDIVLTEQFPPEVCPCISGLNWPDPFIAFNWEVFALGFFNPADTTCADNSTLTELVEHGGDFGSIVTAGVDASVPECYVHGFGTAAALGITPTEALACRQVLRNAAASQGLGCGP